MEQELKQRLIGVIVIVALAVIFFPMLFDQREDKERAANGIPPIPENVLETQLELPKSAEDLAPKEEKAAPESGFRIVPLTDPPVEKKAPTATPPAEQAEASADEPSAEPGDADEDLEVPTTPATKPSDSRQISESAKNGRSSVPEKASTDVAKRSTVAAAKKSQSSAGTESKPAPASARKARPTPPSAITVSKPAAKSSPTKTPAHPDLQAKTAKPEPPAPAFDAKAAISSKPASAALDSKDAWAIQTGSFTSESKAKALAEKLRQSRFPAYVEAADTGHGTTYRVQVGPELDRPRAEQTQKQIESSVGIKGIIVPHP